MDRALVLRGLGGLVAILLVAWLCGVLLREPLVALGQAFLGRLGLAGLFLGVVITDASPLPMTNEPLVLLACSGGVEAMVIFTVVSAASVTAGAVGYTCGRVLGGTFIGRWIRRRYPAAEPFLRAWGAWGVAIAALLPIPFALATWSAGMARVHVGRVLLATLLRIPKTAFYVTLIVQGWVAGA